jgi:carboxylesterase
MSASPIMRGAEPYFQRGNAVGCLCLHGFTATPHEVLWLAQYLSHEGYTVHAPRLAGHGTSPRDLARTCWHDWFASALDGYHLLRQQCDQVFVCGMSMGGLLALRVGMTVPVDGVIVMASPLVQRYPLYPRYLRSMKYVRPYTDQTYRTPFADYVCTQQTRRGESVLGRIRYNLWPTAAVEQLALLIGHVGARLHEITTPLLAIYSEADATVRLESFERLKSIVRSRDTEYHILRKSGHILTQDMECQDVFQKVASFIAHRATSRESGEKMTIEARSS